ncbi:Methyltransferase-like protein 6 [Chytridiales sp. JEL 0842]|nr:Methyltransferase-like protein 6 [Chytridiales sp. JEL 0842]
MQEKLRKEAGKNWDLFYKRNTTNFFKDRHWTWREFPELQSEDKEQTLLEVACDFSTRAVDFVKSNPNYDTKRCNAFVCDLTCNPLTDNIPASSVDIVSAIFVFSAIPPEKQLQAIQNLSTVVKPGGVVIFRDYGVLDEAELRFKPGHWMGEHFYVRQDGTFSIYFSLESLDLWEQAGFVVESREYVKKEVENRKRELKMQRVWVQARFRRKADDDGVGTSQ